jgi:hypothetical protein
MGDRRSGRLCQRSAVQRVGLGRTIVPSIRNDLLPYLIARFIHRDVLSKPYPDSDRRAIFDHNHGVRKLWGQMNRNPKRALYQYAYLYKFDKLHPALWGWVENILGMIKL